MALMDKLEKECESLQPPIRSIVLGEIVCRHLGIALSTPRDLKRIIKNNQGSSVVQKLWQFARDQRNPRVAGGILVAIRSLYMDVVLAREAVKQNLHDFVIQCLDVPSKNLQQTAITTLNDVLSYSPDILPSLDLAVKSNAKITRLIPLYSKAGSSDDNKHIFEALLQIIRCNMCKLCLYRIAQNHALPRSSQNALQLRLLARTLVPLIDVDTSSTVHLEWSTLDLVSECLTWIAYYESKAILSLPSNEGVLLFIAFTLSSSPALRCRGFLGLLNIYSPDFRQDSQEGRLYNPLLVSDIHGLPRQEPFIRQVVEAHIKRTGEEIDALPAETVSAHYHNPQTRVLPDGSDFDAYGSAMRVFDFVTQGPQDVDESFLFPAMRIVKTMEFHRDMEQDMIIALLYHKKNYEADVLKHYFLTQRLQRLKPGRGDPEEGSQVFMLGRLAMDAGLRRWPEKCYFHYAMIQSQAGPQYIELATLGLQSADCTPHIKRQIFYHTSLNLFCMGIMQLSLDGPEPRWWTRGARSIKQACSHIEEALGIMQPGSAEEKILQILKFVTSQLTCTRSSDLDEDLFRFTEVEDALATLETKGCQDHLGLRSATVHLISDRQKATQRWSGLLNVVNKMEHVVEEAHRFSDFREDIPTYEPSDSGRGQNSSKMSRTSLYRADLPRCTWCRRASMALRKCSVCETAKYCRTTCQKSHWLTGHKGECISPEMTA
ncbi:hypothetical protein SISSUDRAFT_1129259 [Sistotremastrum suecicum HHB10207 ss-3]|uniref:MYND-type domain-containing protein n=1 Tax=Sistotremastrum suecicum HHB10207 ss-3 TaxID=1314776 RepID=A0A166CWC6_9AGAM|nr:hypothetical protein SISSUDRAFT_1129259 [Sistotremastrum suecicum HHB10207 ss-3]